MTKQKYLQSLYAKCYAYNYDHRFPRERENLYLRINSTRLEYYIKASVIAGTRHNPQLFLALITRGVKNQIINLEHTDTLLDAYWRGWNKVLRLPHRHTRAQRKAHIERLKNHINIHIQRKIQP